MALLAASNGIAEGSLCGRQKEEQDAKKAKQAEVEDAQKKIAEIMVEAQAQVGRCTTSFLSFWGCSRPDRRATHAQMDKEDKEAASPELRWVGEPAAADASSSDEADDTAGKPAAADAAAEEGPAERAEEESTSQQPEVRRALCEWGHACMTG